MRVGRMGVSVALLLWTGSAAAPATNASGTEEQASGDGAPRWRFVPQWQLAGLVGYDSNPAQAGSRVTVGDEVFGTGDGVAGAAFDADLRWLSRRDRLELGLGTTPTKLEYLGQDALDASAIPIRAYAEWKPSNARGFSGGLEAGHSWFRLDGAAWVDHGYALAKAAMSWKEDACHQVSAYGSLESVDDREPGDPAFDRDGKPGSLGLRYTLQPRNCEEQSLFHRQLVEGYWRLEAGGELRREPADGSEFDREGQSLRLDGHWPLSVHEPRQDEMRVLAFELQLDTTVWDYPQASTFDPSAGPRRDDLHHVGAALTLGWLGARLPGSPFLWDAKLRLGFDRTRQESEASVYDFGQSAFTLGLGFMWRRDIHANLTKSPGSRIQKGPGQPKPKVKRTLP